MRIGDEVRPLAPPGVTVRSLGPTGRERKSGTRAFGALARAFILESTDTGRGGWTYGRCHGNRIKQSRLGAAALVTV